MSELNVGDRFGRLTVIERDHKREDELREKHKGQRYTPHKHYICRCDCGKIKSVDMYSLLRGDATSCGCFKSQDFTGKTIGNLTVIGVSPEYRPQNGKHKMWLCKCNLCGGEVSYRSTDLAQERVSDCGCQKSSRLSRAVLIDLNGKTFGHLHVLGRDTSAGYGSGKHAKWMCYCDLCKRTESIASNVLLRYGRDRCLFCSLSSVGEQKIREFLDERQIPYHHNETYEDCIYPDTDGRLRFDFIVNYGSSGTYMIEYDGEQHFKEIPRWDRGIDLSGRRKRDLFKNEWCARKGYPLIRIPYTRLKSMCYEDINPDTSEYLVSS